MSIFGAILDKLRHHASPSSAPASPDAGLSGSPAPRTDTASAAPGQAAPQQAAPSSPQPAATTGSATAVLQNVDVDAVLAGLASRKGGGGNYRQSIVDLLKLLDLDSSLTARKQLAQELGVHAGADGSAEQNVALHKAVMQKIADNGGKVPDSLKSA